MGQASYKIRCYRQWWENQHRGCTVDHTLSCKYYIQLSIKRLFVVKKNLKWQLWGSSHMVWIGRIDKNFQMTLGSLSLLERNRVLNDLKKDAISKFGIKYWISNSCNMIALYMWIYSVQEKVWWLVKKDMTFKSWRGD